MIKRKKLGDGRVLLYTKNSKGQTDIAVAVPYPRGYKLRLFGDWHEQAVPRLDELLMHLRKLDEVKSCGT